MADAANPAQRLRACLEADDILILPCPYDGLSARLAAEAGFRAAFMGGYAVAAARFAFPDIGLVTATEMLETARAVIRAADIPMLCDGDTGYGGDANIRRTVLDLAQAGAAAVMIEDQTWPKRCGHIPGKSVVAREEAVARIRAAVRAREEAGDTTLILARAVHGLDEALARVRAFADAGADLLFMEAPRDEAEMTAFTSATPLPCLANMLDGGVTPRLPPARLRELGFAMAAYPLDLLGAAAAAVRATLATLGTDGPAPERLRHSELLALTGFEPEPP